MREPLSSSGLGPVFQGGGCDGLLPVDVCMRVWWPLLCQAAGDELVGVANSQTCVKLVLPPASVSSWHRLAPEGERCAAPPQPLVFYCVLFVCFAVILVPCVREINYPFVTFTYAVPFICPTMSRVVTVLIALLLPFSLEFLCFSTDCFDNATLKVTNSDFTQKLWLRAPHRPWAPGHVPGVPVR